METRDRAVQSNYTREDGSLSRKKRAASAGTQPMTYYTHMYYYVQLHVTEPPSTGVHTLYMYVQVHVYGIYIHVHVYTVVTCMTLVEMHELHGGMHPN